MVCDLDHTYKTLSSNSEDRFITIFFFLLQLFKLKWFQNKVAIYHVLYKYVRIIKTIYFTKHHQCKTNILLTINDIFFYFLNIFEIKLRKMMGSNLKHRN